MPIQQKLNPSGLLFSFFQLVNKLFSRNNNQTKCVSIPVGKNFKKELWWSKLFLYFTSKYNAMLYDQKCTPPQCFFCYFADIGIEDISLKIEQYIKCLHNLFRREIREGLCKV